MSESIAADYFNRFRKHSTFLWVASHTLPGFALLCTFVLGDSDNSVVREIVDTVSLPWLLSGPVLALACIAVTPDKQPGRAFMLLVTVLTMPPLSALTFGLCLMVPAIAFPLFLLWLFAAYRAARRGIRD